MTKIEKAVERAEELRRKRLQETPSDAKGEPKIEEKPKPLYSETAVISLDQDHLEKYRLMSLLEDPGAVDCYNLLRTQVLERTRNKGHNAIMITSPGDGDGKTLTSIGLAASIAREAKQSVLLVDTDLRHPNIHRYLGFFCEKGLSDYLQHDADIPELLINPGVPNMVILPAGKPIAGSTDMLGSPKMETLVKEMKHRYPERYVIFDCPPLLTVSDALVFSSYVDGVLLVVQAGATSKREIRKAMELLSGKNVIGLVMNGLKETTTPYYY
jgi:exopolysaccharide/PEP-CTERM locus tyrosine autokinase